MQFHILPFEIQLFMMGEWNHLYVSTSQRPCIQLSYPINHYSGFDKSQYNYIQSVMNTIHNNNNTHVFM